MDSLKTILKFALKVAVAIAVINIIGGYVPAVRSIIMDPLGTLRGNSAA